MIVFLTLLLAFAPIVIVILVLYLQFKNIPEKVERVKVIEKNMRVDYTLRPRTRKPYYTYFITFRCPDGLDKELLFSTGSNLNVYDSIRENDRGTLTYKEREDAIRRMKNEKRHYNEREFISFKKDTSPKP